MTVKNNNAAEARKGYSAKTANDIKTQADYEDFRVNEAKKYAIRKTEVIAPKASEFTFDRTIKNNKIKDKRQIIDSVGFNSTLTASDMQKELTRRSNASLMQLNPDEYKGNSEYIKFIGLTDDQDQHINFDKFIRISELDRKEFEAEMIDMSNADREEFTAMSKSIVKNAILIAFPGLDAFMRRAALLLNKEIALAAPKFLVDATKTLGLFDKARNRAMENILRGFRTTILNSGNIRFNTYNEMQVMTVNGELYKLSGVTQALFKEALIDVFGILPFARVPHDYYNSYDAEGNAVPKENIVEECKTRIENKVPQDIIEKKMLFEEEFRLPSVYGPYLEGDSAMVNDERAPFTHFFRYINLYDDTLNSEENIELILNNIRSYQDKGKFIPILSDRRAYELSRSLMEAAMFDEDITDVIQFVVNGSKNPSEDNFYFAPSTHKKRKVNKKEAVRTEIFQGNYPGTPSNALVSHFTYSEVMDVVKRGNRSEVWDRLDASQVEATRFILNHVFSNDGDSIEYVLNNVSTTLHVTSAEQAANPTMLVFDGGQGAGKSTVAKIFVNALDGLHSAVNIASLANPFTLNEKRNARLLFDDDAPQHVPEDSFSNIKKMTTGAAMSSAGKNKDEQNWIAKQGFIICTNHGLNVNGATEGIGRRATIAYTQKLSQTALNEYKDATGTKALDDYDNLGEVIELLNKGEATVAWMQLQLMTRAIRISRTHAHLNRTPLLEANASTFEEQGNTFKQFIGEEIRENGIGVIDLEAMRNIKFRYSRWCEGNNVNEVSNKIISRTLDEFKFVKENIKYGRRIREMFKAIAREINDRTLDLLILEETISYYEKNKRSYREFSKLEDGKDGVAYVDVKAIDAATRQDIDQAIDDMDVVSVNTLITLIATDATQLDRFSKVGFEQLRSRNYSKEKHQEFVAKFNAIRFHISQYMRQNSRSLLANRIQSSRALVEYVSDKEGAVPVMRVTEKTVDIAKREFNLTDEEVASDTSFVDDYYNTAKLGEVEEVKLDSYIETIRGLKKGKERRDVVEETHALIHTLQLSHKQINDLHVKIDTL